jgi:hypothetical protein
MAKVKTPTPPAAGPIEISLGDHIARYLYIGWRMLWFDKACLKFMDVSGRSVIRSFYALLFAAPFYFLAQYFITLDPVMDDLGGAPFWTLFIGYALAWPVFAFILFHLSKVLDVGPYFIQFIPAYNWARVYTVVAFLPAYALIGFRLIPGWSDNIVLIGTVLWIFAYEVFIIRHTLKAMWFHAVLIAALDFLLFQILRLQILNAFIGVTQSNAAG